jgi:hypothetical protein
MSVRGNLDIHNMHGKLILSKPVDRSFRITAARTESNSLRCPGANRMG